MTYSSEIPSRFLSSFSFSLLFLFTCCCLPAQSWTFQHKILQEGIVEEQEHFGEDLAISDSFMVAGSPFHNWDSLETTRTFSAGAAFVYKRNGDGSWTFSQKLVSPDQQGATFFGNQIEIDDDWLFISCPYGADLANQGPAYAGMIYVYSLSTDGLWILSQTLTAPDAMVGAHFGISLSLSEQQLLVGANEDRRNVDLTDSLKKAGSAYLFELNQTNEWEFIQKLVASDRKEDSRFGTKVDIDGEYLAIGAPSHEVDPFYFEAGQVYIFEKDPSSNLWNEQQIIQDATTDFYENYGNHLSISGDYLVIGNRRTDNFPGGVYINDGGSATMYHRSGSGTWNVTQELFNSAPDRDDKFGSVEMEGEILAIGAIGEDYAGHNQDSVASAGAVYIFELLGNGQWSQRRKLTQPIRNIGDGLGFSLDLHGKELAIGAPYAPTDSLFDAGAAFLFQRDWAVSMETPATNQIFQIISNPSDKLSVSVELTRQESWTMEILTLQGSVVYSPPSTLSNTINVSPQFPDGLYLVTIRTESGLQSTQRWIKMK